MKLLLLIMLSSLSALQVSSEDKLLVIELREDFFKLEDELWKFVLEQKADERVDPEITVIRKLYDFDQKVKQMPQDMLYGMEVIREVNGFLLLYSDLRVVHDMYEKFRRYQLTKLLPIKNSSEFNVHMSTEVMVGDILDVENNINATLEKIAQELFSNESENIFWEVYEIILNDDYNCKYNQVTAQIFYNLYNTIALIELKGYIMTEFAYLGKRVHQKGNYTEESLLAREHFKKRSMKILATLRGFLEIGDNKRWRCDPKSWIEGSNYVQVTRLLQGHIQNEVDLNSRGTCTESCGAYPLTKNYGCYDSDSEYCKKRKPCHGDIRNCRFVESHMRACISPATSLRRYEFIEYESGKILGDKRSCWNKDVNSWFRWFVHCSYCLCLCDEQGPLSDRYFNMRPVMSDVTNNRVITGLRLIKHNRIIHLQIQEGKLLPYGYIDNNTVKWVPVDDYKITDPGLKSGKDYHTITYNNRKILLDELHSYESNHILTGVKFEIINGYLRFQINVRPFDFKSGILLKESHELYGSGFRSKINLDRLDIPTKSTESKPEWKSDEYLEFTHTDFDKDAAQTTIPFIDSQPVTNYPQVPLRGAGIYYKNQESYGGFIAPSIRAYDYSKHMVMEFPDPEKREDLIEYFEILSN